MIRYGGITRLISIALMLGMVGFAVVSFSKVRSDLEALRKISKEDIYWSAAQLEVELKRFLDMVGRYGVGVAGVDARDVQDRFDILWSRVELFRVGEVGARLSAYDERSGVIRRLRSALVEYEDLVLAADRGDPEGLRAIIAAFSPFDEAMRDLAGRVSAGEEARVAAARQTLRDNAQLSAALVAGALAVGIALLVMMYFEARRYAALADHNKHLAEEARVAGEAKSRFLSMMSHELRTPMNGVLGLLALVKQRGLPTAQQRLVDQAERSGRQMIDLLTDILDFSALQREELTLQSRAFEIAELGDALRDLFCTAARREGVECEIACAPGTNRRLIGDFNRIRQSLNHLAAHVIETAGTREIRMDLSYEDKRLVALLSFDYIGGATGGWRPEVMLGEVEARRDSLVTDSLGPAVARGLIGEMGGDIAIKETGGGRIQVRVSLPCDAVAETARPDVTQVLIDIHAPELAAACRKLLSGEDVVLVGDGAAEVDAVIIDAGGADEAQRVAAARRMHPKARIVALGLAGNSSLFDAIVTSDLDMAAVRSALDLQSIA